jgi:hypothetical protein
LGKIFTQPNPNPLCFTKFHPCDAERFTSCFLKYDKAVFLSSSTEGKLFKIVLKARACSGTKLFPLKLPAAQYQPFYVKSISQYF